MIRHLAARLLEASAARMRLPLLLLAILGTAAPLRAETTHDGQLWGQLTTLGTLKGRAIYHVEVQPRTSGGLNRVGQLLLRGAVGYKFSDAVSLYAGYLHLIQPVYGGKDRNEERPFLQLSWQMGEIAGGRFSTRTRLEYRSVSAGPDHGARIRSMLRYMHPVGDPAAPRALVWAEPFFAFSRTSGGAAPGFDQLRSFVGTEIPIGGRSTVEAGYMNQAINDPGPRNRMNHVLSLTLFYRP